MTKEEEDKSTLIANLVVLWEPGATTERYLEMAKELWPLSIQDLLAMSEKIMLHQLQWETPFRQMVKGANE